MSGLSLLFPPVPAPRVAWDIDGTVGVVLDSSAVYTRDMTQAEMETLNKEDNTNANFGTGWFALVFPDPLDIVGRGFFKSNSTAHNRGPQFSLDTTNGVDGTWTNFSTTNIVLNCALNYRTAWRLAPVPSAELGVAGVRWGATSTTSSRHVFQALHLYGHYQPAGLELWHPDLDEAASGSWLDFGDIQRDDIYERSFRIKNVSATKTAQGVSLQDETITGVYQQFGEALEFSIDGGLTWGGYPMLGDLVPGEISSVVRMRLELDDTARLGTFAARFLYEPTSWL